MPPPPPPPPSEPASSNTPLILGIVTALGGAGGWYYFSQNKAKEEDVKQKARELDHAARAQAQKKVDEGKAKIDELKVHTACYCRTINH